MRLALILLLLLGYAAASEPPHVCGDGEECPGNFPCCHMGKDEYACCPIDNGVCCDGSEFCYEHGHNCSGVYQPEKLSKAVLISGNGRRGTLTMKLLIASAAKAKANSLCPDNETECSTDTTCCKVTGGKYGCCPYVKAVCCSDGEHCCPNGFSCELESGSCVKSYLPEAVRVPMLRKLPALPMTANYPGGRKPSTIVCPDGKSECENKQTCCKLASGTYGCCPYEKATCCSDGQHCCPTGYTCDESQGKCIGSDQLNTMVLSTIGKDRSLVSVVCPDGKAKCSDEQTCCKLASGEFGCCPYPNAVCCSDGKHCCPDGYSCDVTQGDCVKGNQSYPMLQKLPSRQPESAKNVHCYDGQSQCANGQTCCPLKSTGYACCPHTHAVCCSDHKNCCPNGYTCNMVKRSCVKTSDSVLTLFRPNLKPSTSRLQRLKSTIDERRRLV